MKTFPNQHFDINDAVFYSTFWGEQGLGVILSVEKQANDIGFYYVVRRFDEELAMCTQHEVRHATVSELSALRNRHQQIADAVANALVNSDKIST